MGSEYKRGYHLLYACVLLASCGGGGQAGTTLSARDRTGPTVAITADKSTLRVEDETPVFFDWSEPVQGFTSANVAAQGGRLEKFTQLSEQRYSATFISETSVATPLTITVGRGAALDLAGNQSTQLTSKAFTVDERPPVIYTLSKIPLSYTPFTTNSYYSPGNGTVNIGYGPFVSPKMYGADFPTQFLVMSQYSKTLSKIDTNGSVIWNYPSFGIFVTLNGSNIFTASAMGNDVVDVIDLNGQFKYSMKFSNPVNYIRVFGNRLVVVYNTIQPAEIYSWDEQKGIGALQFVSTGLSYARAGVIQGDVIAFADTFGLRVVLQSLLNGAILADIPAYFPNDISWRGDFLYVVEEHHDRIFAWNTLSAQKFVVMAPPNPRLWDPNIAVPSEETGTCGNDPYGPRSLSADICSGDFTLYAPNGLALRKDGMLVADTDDSRVVYVKDGKVVSVLVGLTNPVKIIALN